MFSIDKRSSKNLTMKNPGPYEARVTSHLDSKYSGTEYSEREYWHRGWGKYN